MLFFDITITAGREGLGTHSGELGNRTGSPVSQVRRFLEESGDRATYRYQRAYFSSSISFGDEGLPLWNSRMQGPGY